MRGYSVPDQPDGHPTVCFQMQIPNAPEYRQAILGQISHLFRWYAWERTGTRAGAETAEVLKQYALTMQFIQDCQEAGINVIFRQTDCTLEASTDDGQTWQVIFDANPCKPTLIFQDGDIIYDGNTVIYRDEIIKTVIQPDTNHIANDGYTKRCNLSTYLVDVPLPSLFQSLLNEHANANGDNTALIIGVLTISAALLTGGIALGIPAIYAGFGLGSMIGTGAAVGIVGILNQVDINQASAEATPQFWEDVRCVIYCNISNDAILHDHNMETIADVIDRDLTATYPNATPIVSGIFRTTNPEARERWQVIGALYENRPCICGCIYWYTIAFGGQISPISNQPKVPWVSKYFIFDDVTYYDENIKAIVSNSPTATYDRIECILDVSKTPCRIHRWAIDGRAYKEGVDDPAPRVARVSIWNETTAQWEVNFEASTRTSGLNSFPGSQTQLPYSTIKMKVELEGWGTHAEAWKSTKLRDFRVYIEARDIFYDQWVEEGILP